MNGDRNSITDLNDDSLDRNTPIKQYMCANTLHPIIKLVMERKKRLLNSLLTLVMIIQFCDGLKCSLDFSVSDRSKAILLIWFSVFA